MTSMREKIARAIEPLAWHSMDMGTSTRMSASRRARSLRMADAVLDALMEPTESMLQSGVLGVPDVDAIDWVSALVATGIGSYQALLLQSYVAMIKAAKEGK